MFIFFFFQAEDGIRDTSVTGVQTCALPISNPYNQHFDRGVADYDLQRVFNFSGVWALPVKPAKRLANFFVGGWNLTRSEERRVGKECRSRWWRAAGTKKRT